VLVSNGKERCVIIAGGGFKSTATSFLLCEAGTLLDLLEDFGLVFCAGGIPVVVRKGGAIAEEVLGRLEGL